MNVKNVLRIVALMCLILIMVAFVGIDEATSTTSIASAANTTHVGSTRPALDRPLSKQLWIWIHHEAQGEGDESWTKCMPDDAWNGHEDHEGDVKGGECTPPPPPQPEGCRPAIAPTPTPLPRPPEQGCGQYRVVNDSTDIVEIHPGQSLIAIKNNRTQWALDIPPNPPDKLGLTFKGQVFGTGPRGNVNASWMTIFTWNGLKGWKAWWTFRSPKCQPQDDLVFRATDSGITYVPKDGWQVDPAGPIQYKFY